MRKSLKRLWRFIQASVRDTRILLREFRAPLFWFSFAVIGGGLLYHYIAIVVHEPVASVAEAIYIVLIATFLQPPNRDFPLHIALQLFHFLMPIVGVIALAQGLADFGSLLFNRKSRNKEWEMAVASTMKNHVILVGFGHLGYRVAVMLHEMGKQIVVIEQNPKVDTLNEATKLGIPVITDDATRIAALEGANVQKAKTLILASQNDAMNLQIALKARSLNPNIQIVVRIFDDDFAHALQEQFGFIALSATEMAAPVFAAAAAGVDVTNPISIEGQLLSLAKFTVGKESALRKKSIGDLEKKYKVNIVLLRKANETYMPPKYEQIISVGDALAALGAPEQLNKILHDNE